MLEPQSTTDNYLLSTIEIVPRCNLKYGFHQIFEKLNIAMHKMKQEEDQIFKQ